MSRTKKTEEKDEFPYDTFPYLLKYVDGKDKKKCYFQTEYHMKKHIERYKLKKKDYTAGYKFDESKLDF